MKITCSVRIVNTCISYALVIIVSSCAPKAITVKVCTPEYTFAEFQITCMNCISFSAQYSIIHRIILSLVVISYKHFKLEFHSWIYFKELWVFFSNVYMNGQLVSRIFWYMNTHIIHGNSGTGPQNANRAAKCCGKMRRILRPCSRDPVGVFLYNRFHLARDVEKTRLSRSRNVNVVLNVCYINT